MKVGVEPRLPWKHLALSLAITLGWMVMMQIAVKPLTSQDIVRFELARTVDNAVFILSAWELRGVTDLFIRSVYLDFVFLVLYCYTLSVVCRALSQLAGGWLRQSGIIFSKVIWLAGLFDIIENISMINSVKNSPTPATVLMAEYSASIKFLLVLLTLISIMASLGRIGLSKLKS